MAWPPRGPLPAGAVQCTIIARRAGTGGLAGGPDIVGGVGGHRSRRSTLVAAEAGTGTTVQAVPSSARSGHWRWWRRCHRADRPASSGETTDTRLSAPAGPGIAGLAPAERLPFECSISVRSAEDGAAAGPPPPNWPTAQASLAEQPPPPRRSRPRRVGFGLARPGAAVRVVDQGGRVTSRCGRRPRHCWPRWWPRHTETPGPSRRWSRRTRPVDDQRAVVVEADRPDVAGRGGGHVVEPPAEDRARDCPGCGRVRRHRRAEALSARPATAVAQRAGHVWA